MASLANMMVSTMKRLNQIDTNLLIALDVLLDERHVTRAAQRLAVTQSAMSQTLRRLRDTFEDPLLVRSGATMVPTPRARALRAPLRNALRSLEEALNLVDQFEPAQAVRQFKVACLDFYGVSLIPRLMMWPISWARSAASSASVESWRSAPWEM